MFELVARYSLKNKTNNHFLKHCLQQLYCKGHIHRNEHKQMLCYSLLLCVTVHKVLNTYPNASYTALPEGVAITSSSCIPCLRMFWLLVTRASIRWPLTCWLCVVPLLPPLSRADRPLIDVLEGLASHQLLFSSIASVTRLVCPLYVDAHVRPLIHCDSRPSQPSWQPSWEKTVFGLWSFVARWVQAWPW